MTRRRFQSESRIAPRVETLERRELLSADVEGMYPLANPSGRNSIIVSFDQSAGADQIRAAARAVNGYVADQFESGSSVIVVGQGVDRDAAVGRLRGMGFVNYAEANTELENTAVSNDTYYTSGSLWGMYGDASSPANVYGSGAAEAWAAGVTGSNTVYVGVIDEGIQYNHTDLNGQVWTNSLDPVDGKDNDGNGYVDDIHGWDFANNNNSIYDGGKRGRSDDHGTHVAGTIGAKGGNAKGVVGVNWNVQLISAKFLNPNGGTIANAIKAVDYITDLKLRQGLNIVATNNSWGGGGYSQGLYDAIKRANDANILFIAAAGNSGSNSDTTAAYPAGYNLPNVISVAAIDSTGKLASFSNYGATTVDLGAPGVGIVSTTAYNTYSSYSGTSMAAPHVTGAAALYASVHPGATAAEIKSAILGSVTPTSSLAGKTVTGGRLDIGKLING